MTVPERMIIESVLLYQGFSVLPSEAKEGSWTSSGSCPMASSHLKLRLWLMPDAFSSRTTLLIADMTTCGGVSLYLTVNYMFVNPIKFVS